MEHTTTAPETRREPPAVVELIGAPGAGKSTLLPAVLEACRDEGLVPFTVVDGARTLAARTPLGRAVRALVPGRRRRAALWALFLGFRSASAVGFALRNGRLAWYVVASARRRPRAADARRRKVLHWYVRLAGSYRFLLSRARTDEALVLDEGFAHRAVQLHASAVEVPAAERIERYAALIPRPDLLVYVRAPVEVCIERIRSRGVWDRMRDREPPELDRFVASSHRAASLLADAARRRGWPIVEIETGGRDASRSTAETTASVAAALAGLHRGAQR